MQGLKKAAHDTATPPPPRMQPRRNRPMTVDFQLHLPDVIALTAAKSEERLAPALPSKVTSIQISHKSLRRYFIPQILLSKMADPAATNRSLNTIRTELEYLRDSNIVNPAQFQSIMAQLPVRTTYSLIKAFGFCYLSNHSCSNRAASPANTSIHATPLKACIPITLHRWRRSRRRRRIQIILLILVIQKYVHHLCHLSPWSFADICSSTDNGRVSWDPSLGTQLSLVLERLLGRI